MDAKDLTLGEKIRTYRIRADLTQEALAEKVGVHLATISRWERDESTEEMPVSSLRKLAEALNIRIGILVNHDAA